MSDKLNKTVRIVRPAKVTTDDRGRTVWDGPVEETELELVSTTMLKKMLDSDDAQNRKRLEEAADGKDGVLAQNLTSGSFEIIDDDDLKAALASADDDSSVPAADVTYEPLMEQADTGDEELSLVSTQALKRILNTGDAGDTSDDDPVEDEPFAGGGGFDPYNSA
ncbi:MAG: hypothetical protein QNJ00_10335 [Woeseiaceae bacterium]|nr:hypothetical protein [Woeseiaceae bacterium]